MYEESCQSDKQNRIHLRHRNGNRIGKDEHRVERRQDGWESPADDARFAGRRSGGGDAANVRANCGTRQSYLANQWVPARPGCAELV
jgi:hypothetical protein